MTVHIEIGAFHKAIFTDDLMAKTDGDYKIIAVNLRSANNRNLLKKSDYLYISIERFPLGEKAWVIGALEKV